MRRAIHNGGTSGSKSAVPSHQWEFGDMPSVDGVSEQDVARIASYIRELQRANGIE
ncbi:hypothetical protein [Tropicimonas sp. IMCC6043]|uniref:hypothetical protein n=1 Tax=Tropicimonas sp. IMCC6043 TaxID=2510645 RepID=UPI0013EB2F80|nr:hypothetical protein [Tropicimonas sp. IMCC6043]